MKALTEQGLIGLIDTMAKDKPRFLVAVAGPPGAGKSTIAETLTARISHPAAVVPMDGYHLDNGELVARNLLPRKGAPETFDAAGFLHLVQQLKTPQAVDYPTFDRAADATVPGGGTVSADTQVLVLEGNYLLLDAPVWRDLAPLFDLTVMLDVPRDVLRARLIDRWRHHGLSDADAVARAEGNDLRNADAVQQGSRPADVRVALAL